MPVQGLPGWALGLFWLRAEKVPEAFSIFGFSFFCFLFDFFITFDFDIQMSSNQFQFFSKIQNNNIKTVRGHFSRKKIFQQYFTCLANMALFAYSKIEIGFKNNPLKFRE
jgi:hypothetical protein